MGIDAIPDDLLELVLLRATSPVCIIRAASTCRRWRRIVTGAGFLPRFRSVHGPAVAGVYKEQCRTSYYQPNFVPSQPALVDKRYFSLDFLPDSEIRPWVWRIQDSRGSLLLLDRLRNKDGQGITFQDMIICEPVTRRYQPIAASAMFGGYTVNGAYLLDGDNYEGGSHIDMSNFRVLFMLYASHCQYPFRRHHARVFTSARRSCFEISEERVNMQLVGLTKGSVYWYNGAGTVVALDRGNLQLSSIWDGTVHKHYWIVGCIGTLAVTDGHDGEARIVTVQTKGHLSVYARHQGVNGEWAWALEKTRALSVVMRSLLGYDPSWYFGDLEINFVHKESKVMIEMRGAEKPSVFSLDISTFEIESETDMAYTCELPWPPLLHACTEHDRLAMSRVCYQ